MSSSGSASSAAAGSAATSITGCPASRSTGAMDGASTSTAATGSSAGHLGRGRLAGGQFVRRRPRVAVGRRLIGRLQRGFLGKSVGRGFRHLRRGRDRLGRGQEHVGMARRGVPDLATAHAAHLAPARLQACQLDIVGCSAGRADDQHWRIRVVGTFCGDPSTRSVNGLETMPAGPAGRAMPAPRC